VLLRLWEALKPRRVFHWGGFDLVGKMAFLNGPGFLRLVLDRYQGSQAYLLYPQDEGAQSRSAELLALGVVDGDRSAVILSSFSPQPSDVTRPVIVDLPSGVLAGAAPMKSIRYRQSNNVHARIRSDLQADDNLKLEFAGCALCLGAPLQMARDAERARAMLARNWQRYVEAMKDNLRWDHKDAGISRAGARLRVTLEPNELVVIE
jgi:hypothetical protein